jgi:hypothetical protein
MQFSCCYKFALSKVQIVQIAGRLEEFTLQVTDSMLRILLEWLIAIQLIEKFHSTEPGHTTD